MTKTLSVYRRAGKQFHSTQCIEWAAWDSFPSPRLS